HPAVTGVSHGPEGISDRYPLCFSATAQKHRSACNLSTALPGPISPRAYGRRSIPPPMASRSSPSGPVPGQRRRPGSRDSPGRRQPTSPRTGGTREPRMGRRPGPRPWPALRQAPALLPQPRAARRQRHHPGIGPRRRHAAAARPRPVHETGGHRMAEITAETSAPPAVPWHAAIGARDACNAVARILRREPLPAAEHYDQDRAESGSVFLAQLLYAVRLANGLDPRSTLPAAGGRGADLARQFVLGEVVQVCCPYCGILMMQAVAHLI